MAKKVEKPYYQEFKNILGKKLDVVSKQIEPENSGALFENLTPEAVSLKDLATGVTKHPFRYYQKEAIYTLHHIYKDAINIAKKKTRQTWQILL